LKDDVCALRLNGLSAHRGPTRHFKPGGQGANDVPWIAPVEPTDPPYTARTPCPARRFPPLRASRQSRRVETAEVNGAVLCSYKEFACQNLGITTGIVVVIIAELRIIQIWTAP